MSMWRRRTGCYAGTRSLLQSRMKPPHTDLGYTVKKREEEEKQNGGGY